jgi:hypothetical protein
MFVDKVFQTMIFSRHMQEASHFYENFELESNFTPKILWYLKYIFLLASQTHL